MTPASRGQGFKTYSGRGNALELPIKNRKYLKHNIPATRQSAPRHRRDIAILKRSKGDARVILCAIPQQGDDLSKANLVSGAGDARRGDARHAEVVVRVARLDARARLRDGGKDIAARGVVEGGRHAHRRGASSDEQHRNSKEQFLHVFPPGSLERLRSNAITDHSFTRSHITYQKADE